MSREQRTSIMTDGDGTGTERTAAMGDDVVRYTTASDSYDEFGTRTVEPSCRQWQGAVVRGVTIPPDGLTWQVMRYESGLYSVWERLDDIPGGA